MDNEKGKKVRSLHPLDPHGGVSLGQIRRDLVALYRLMNKEAPAYPPVASTALPLRPRTEGRKSWES